MIDGSVSIFMSNVTDYRVSWVKVVGNINGHSFSWKKIPNILLYEVSGGSIEEFSVELTSHQRMASLGENSLQHQLLCDGPGHLHFTGKIFHTGGGHGFIVIINGMKTFQISEVFCLIGEKPSIFLASLRTWMVSREGATAGGADKGVVWKPGFEVPGESRALEAGPKGFAVVICFCNSSTLVLVVSLSSSRTETLS